MLWVQGAALPHVRGHVRIMRESLGLLIIEPGVTLIVHPRGIFTPTLGWCHSFLLLSSIAEPDPNNLFFQLEAVSEASYLLGRRLRILIKVLL